MPDFGSRTTPEFGRRDPIEVELHFLGEANEIPVVDEDAAFRAWPKQVGILSNSTRSCTDKKSRKMLSGGRRTVVPFALATVSWDARFRYSSP